jgi:hypothetical protein
MFLGFVSAAFEGASTEATNGDVAAKYAEVADAYDAIQPPADAPQWEALGEIIDEYAAQWSALPADGVAGDNVEAVESAVDDLAQSQDFDNDDYDDLAPVVGAACAEELEAAMS